MDYGAMTSLLGASALSVLAGWAIVRFAFVVWGIDPRGRSARSAGFAVIHAAAVAGIASFADLWGIAAGSVVAAVALCFVLFRSIPLRIRVGLASTAALIFFFLDGYAFPIAAERPLALLFLFPAIVLVQAAASVMRRRGVSPGVVVLQTLESMRRRSMVYLLLFLLLQCVIVLLFVWTVYDFGREDARPAAVGLVFASCLLGLAVLLLAVRAIALNKEETARATRDHYIEDIGRMYATIREQRQDFMRHAKTILSCVERDDLSELKRYTDTLVGEISQVNELLRIGHPAFAALIQAKTVVALNRNIDFQYEFSDLDNLDIGVKSIDLVKMVGNLIDNAFDEAAKYEREEDRWVEVGGWVDRRTLYVTVRNHGRPLDERQVELLFSPGFTTKRDGHSGLGLSIVKERIDYYKGTIRVESSEEEGILFKLSIPLGPVKAAVV
ncbi:sensor histidine kinase [Paenibacillus flagellatus]|uniref:histidine kinase n=1 Tax=Paenibacillus flagellatus TaxID=2211139 RepID=A0A2V5KFA4_9BACL|nr:sensor histidine kinase [Paenibacillus flagellatus]PYI57074.1 hypothetical protein DLM86_01090 [Paenibacillus flagellatus]